VFNCISAQEKTSGNRFYRKIRDPVMRLKTNRDFSGFICDRDCDRGYRLKPGSDSKTLPWRNPVFQGLILLKIWREVIVRGSSFHHQKNPCNNSGTSEPAASPVVPHFPHPQNSEVTIHKNAEPGRNEQDISDGNERGHIWPRYSSQRQGGMWFGT
jgi:hypothetical protein